MSGNICKIDFVNLEGNGGSQNLYHLNFEVEYFVSNQRIVQNLNQRTESDRPVYTEREAEALLREYHLGKQVDIYHPSI